LPHLFQESDAARIPAFFLDTLNTAKAAERRIARLFRVHPTSYVAFDLFLQMKLQLFFQFVFHPGLEEQRS